MFITKHLHEQFGSVFYKCDICYNCFENNINLSLRHMKTVHEGDKDFKCESCANHLLKLIL